MIEIVCFSMRGFRKVDIIIREMNKFDAVKCKELIVQSGFNENLLDFDKRFSCMLDFTFVF